MRALILGVVLVLCGTGELLSQTPYTSKKFAYRIETHIPYAVDTAFDGQTDTLRLDLYKPLNDSNCRRPVLIVVHGGAWLGGNKSGGSIPAICTEFAMRGYVVASISYRLGMHPASYYVPYALCVQEKCSYTADTSEWIRAAFRAMQDVKTAIRFMKSRNGQDSSDHKNVFLLGESAGAFTSILAAWMDREAEKPASCLDIADAPLPDDDLSHCVQGNTLRKRPDLGSFRGKFYLDRHDEKVKGVAAFYGGVLDTAIFRQSDPSDTPVLYLYHQTCDVVVDHSRNKLFGKLYQYCYNPVNLCMSFTSGPAAWGSSGIYSHLIATGMSNDRLKYTLLTGGGNYNCSPSSNCHGIDALSVRMKEVADFFAPVIAASGNVPSLDHCSFSAEDHGNFTSTYRIHPNPGYGRIILQKTASGQGFPATCILQGMDGKVHFSTHLSFHSGISVIQIPESIPAGVYLIKITDRFASQSLKYILER